MLLLITEGEKEDGSDTRFENWFEQAVRQRVVGGDWMGGAVSLTNWRPEGSSPKP